MEFADDSEDWVLRISSGTGELTGNVYSFITEVSNRISVTSPRGKNIDGMVRIDDVPVVRAQRELLVNALVHADYYGLRGIRAERRGNSFAVRNPGSLRIPLDMMLEGGVSDPRNPRLALMMGLIGLSERAGSGVSDVVSACRRLGIPGPEYAETSDPETVTVRLRLDPSTDAGDREREILGLMKKDPSVSIDKMSDKLGLERNRTARIINTMKADGRVRRIGGTRGQWSVSE